MQNYPSNLHQLHWQRGHCIYTPLAFNADDQNLRNSSGLSRAASISPSRGSAPRPLPDKAGPCPVLLFSRVDLLIVILSSFCMYPTADSEEPGPDCKSTLMINRFWSEGINTPTGCQPASTISKMSNEIQDKHSHTSVPSGGQGSSLNNRNMNSRMIYLFKTL